MSFLSDHGLEVIIAVIGALGIRELLAYLVRRMSEKRRFSAEAQVVEATAHETESKALSTSAEALIAIQRQMFEQMQAERVASVASATQTIHDMRVLIETATSQHAECERRVSGLAEENRALQQTSTQLSVELREAIRRLDVYTPTPLVEHIVRLERKLDEVISVAKIEQRVDAAIATAVATPPPDPPLTDTVK